MCHYASDRLRDALWMWRRQSAGHRTARGAHQRMGVSDTRVVSPYDAAARGRVARSGRLTTDDDALRMRSRRTGAMDGAQEWSDALLLYAALRGRPLCRALFR